MSERLLPVPDGLAGERLDQALTRLLGLSRSRAADLIAEGAVLVDGAPASKSDRLLAGSLLTVDLRDPQMEPVAPPEPVPGMRILFDDEDVVVVDKPVGVAAHPSPGWRGPTVIGGLAAAGYRISTSGASERQGVVHRLDVGTSGAMAVAKSEAAYTHLKRQFKERTSFHDIPRGPDASEDNRKIADWCEQLIKYVGTVMLKDVTTFEWSPVKSYQRMVRILLQEGVQDAKALGMLREPEDFVKAAFGKTATMQRAMTRTPSMLDALKLLAVTAAPTIAMRQQRRTVDAAQLLPLAASSEWRLPIIGPETAAGIYASFWSTVTGLVPELPLYRASYGWPMDLTRILVLHGRQINARFAATQVAYEQDADAHAGDSGSDQSAVDTVASPTGARRQKSVPKVRHQRRASQDDSLGGSFIRRDP